MSEIKSKIMIVSVKKVKISVIGEVEVYEIGKKGVISITPNGKDHYTMIEYIGHIERIRGNVFYIKEVEQ